MDLATLATAISRKRGDLHAGVASAGGTVSALTDTRLVLGGDNEYRGHELLFPSHAGTTAIVTASTTTSAGTVLTFAPALATVVAAAEAYEKRKRHYYDDVVAAINAAIRDIADVAPVDAAADTSLTLDSGTYEYAIPATFTHLNRVEIKNEDDEYCALAPLQWGMRAGRKLWIAPSFAESYDGYGLRLNGYKKQAELSARTDTCLILPAYIVAYADWYLMGQLVDVDAKALLAAFQIKEAEHVHAITPLRADTRKVLL